MPSRMPLHSQIKTPAKKSNKNLPNHPIQFATLEIENRKTKRHPSGGVFSFSEIGCPIYLAEMWG
jgi:hypothetical protein